jgi:5-methyltetrahydropteroyltriglutamate--homocysteine methyltransferase
MSFDTVTYRAEVVGSMLRPEYLKDARAAHEAGSLGAREFKSIEDRAVDEVIAVQEEAGVDVVSDGELRRSGFIGSLTEIVEGIGPASGAPTEWHRDSGETEDYEAPVAVLGRLRRVRSLAVEEYAYARARTELPVKVTLPSPLMLAYFWSPEHTTSAYTDVFELIEDGAQIVREEIADLVRMGCPYIQIDAPELAVWDTGEQYAARFAELSGLPVREMVQRAPEILSSVVEGFSNTTFGLHLCRGNNEGRWQAAGGYERLAKDVFEGAASYDTFLLEYDDERAGSLQALADLPKDKMVVLGLVTTKASRMETPEQLRGRIDEATQYFPLDKLALSTQCGFASMAPGNPAMNAELQEAKLRLVARVARDVWGQAPLTRGD